MTDYRFSPHHRRSIRLKGYDYSSEGTYFITIVSYQRENLFGSIIEGKMHLTELGIIVQRNWSVIPEHFDNTILDEFIVMPNHLHGIIQIYQDDSRGTKFRAPMDAVEQFGKPVHGSIPTIVRTFKASVTRDARRELNVNDPIWQRNYYEHVIGLDREYEAIAEYIDANPRNWLSDQENKRRSQTREESI